MKNASSTDKGIYKLIAKNEKGEVVSNPIEVIEVAEEKGEKPTIDKKLKSIVSSYEKLCYLCENDFCILVPLTNETYILAYPLYNNLVHTKLNLFVNVMLTTSKKKIM